MKRKQITAMITTMTMVLGITACGAGNVSAEQENKEQTEIESILNISNNDEITWSYDSQSDSWTMSVTCAVANPELPDYQGVSVNVPGAYVKGIDTDGDGTEDVTGKTYSEEVNGQLVIDDSAKITNANGQTYTASTAPVIINTGAAGYSAQENQKASSGNAAYGYINVACGNRGKQSTATDENGEEYYTGDAPLCLVDQKNAIRFVKYNIILGNLPGNTEYFVSTGGSGGGAHAAMVAATSDNSDYFPYEVEAGAVGIYQNEDGTYSETIGSENTEISDGVWGCVAYSAITSLQEADMAMAFEYYLDTDYEFNTDFQKKLAECLSKEYMEYINDQNLSVSESAVDIDINGDGDKDDVVDLTIEYDVEKYADTNGYGGTYLTLYLKEFEKNLEWYLENLDYADDWTWFDSDGNALSDESVSQMTTEEKAHFWKDDMPKENPDKMQVQETECQMEMVRMEMKCRVKSRTEYRIEMTQMEKSRMEHQPEACQVEKLRTAMLKMTWLQVEWEMRSELRMPELHSLQVQKQILQTTAVMKKCWNLMKVISPLSRMVTNTEIIL